MTAKDVRHVIFCALCIIMCARGISSAADEISASLFVPDARLNERVISITGDDVGSVKLQVTLFTADGPGPFTLAVMNHGSDGNTSAKRNPRNRSIFATYYFLSRGYCRIRN
jgi:hypothetical protein